MLCNLFNAMRISVVLFYLRHHRLPGLQVFPRILLFQPRRMRRGLLMGQTNHLTLMLHRRESWETRRIQRWRTCSSPCISSLSSLLQTAEQSKALALPRLPHAWLAALTAGERNKFTGLNNPPFPSELWIRLVQLVPIKAC